MERKEEEAKAEAEDPEEEACKADKVEDNWVEVKEVKEVRTVEVMAVVRQEAMADSAEKVEETEEERCNLHSKSYILLDYFYVL